MYYNNLHSLASKALILLLSLFILIPSYTNIKAEEQSEEELAYFIVEKRWENDLESERPEVVNIIIEGSDGSSYTNALSKSEEYKAVIVLPSKSNDTDINYTVYEVEPEDFKYISTANQGSKLALNGIAVPSYIYYKNLQKITNPQVNKTDGFSSVPEGSIILNQNLDLTQAQITLPNGYSYSEALGVYNDFTKKTINNICPRIQFQGSFPHTGSENEKVILEWEDSAYDYLTGEYYNLRISINNITIECADDTEHENIVSIVSYESNCLNMQAYLAGSGEFSTKKALNIFGVSADILVEVIDKNSNPIPGYTQVYIDDIDIPDYKSCFEKYNSDSRINEFYGINTPYNEGVELKQGVVSDVYLNQRATWVDYGDNKFKSQSGHSNLSGDPRTAIKFLAKTDGYSFTWTGSDCGSAIIFKSQDTNNYPDTSTFTNIFTNTSAFYKVQYYYQNSSDGYSLFKETEVSMGKPNTDVSVTSVDKIPDPSKPRYVLNEVKDEDWTSSLKSSHTSINPLILKLYFDRVPDVSEKKEYFVIEKVWENDDEALRPENIEIVIEGPNNFKTETSLLKTNDYKAFIKLPVLSSGHYQVYEKLEGLDNYLSSNSSSNPLTIKSIIIDDNSDRSVVGEYIVNKTGFENVPNGNVVIDENLPLSEAIMTLPENFIFAPEAKKYGNPFNENGVAPGEVNVAPRILYTGNLNREGNNIPGKISLLWENKATDFLTGEEYDLRVSLSNINIWSEENTTNKPISVLSNTGEILTMESFVSQFTKNNPQANVVGVSADIEVEILGSDGFVQVYITDLDVGDYAMCYYEKSSNWENYMSSYHKITNPYVESVTLLNGVASDIFVDPNTRLITNDDNSRFIDGKGSTDVDSPKNSLEFLASSSSFSYRWTGSKCGTALLLQGPSQIPNPDLFTNSITNISAFYKVKYFYENEQGRYDLFEETEVRQGKPTSQVIVTSEDKIPSEQKPGYSLNETLLEKWSGLLTTEHTKDNPLVLEVYFDISPTGSVLVEHRDEETLELLKPSEEVASDEPIGTPYTTSEEIFTDYTFSKIDPDSAPASGSVTEELQTVVYLYKKARGTVKVEHRDYNTNELLTEVETVKDNERVGEPYQTSQKEFENYYFVKHDENSAPESGVVKSHLQTVVYYYGQEEEISVIEETGSVEVKYVDEETNELIIPREIVKNKAPVGEEYITEEKVFPNYLFTKMAETSDAPRGQVEVGHKIVIYMYRPVYSEDYTFLSGTPDKELPPEVLGLLPTRAYKYFNESSVDADIVPTREVEVPGGKWVFKDWNDPTLIVNREDVHFVGIWVFEAAPFPPVPKGRVSVVYKTVDGKILKPEEMVLEDEIGEPYSTEELTFEGYTFVETTGDDPLGHLEEKDKLVIYLYEKDKEPTPPEPTGTVCVVYKDDEGNILEKENCFLVDVPINTPYDTEKKTFLEYNFKTIEGEPSGKVIEGTIKIAYIYSKIKKGTVEVIYIDDSGKTLKGPEVVLKDVEVGKDYSTSKLSFDGYDFLKVDEKSAPVSGKVKEGTQRVIYVYKKTPIVTNVPVNTGVGDTAMLVSLALFASSILLVILKKQKQKIGS